MCRAGLEVILSIGPLPNCSLSFPILGVDKMVLFYFYTRSNETTSRQGLRSPPRAPQFGSSGQCDQGMAGILAQRPGRHSLGGVQQVLVRVCVPVSGAQWRLLALPADAPQCSTQGQLWRLVPLWLRAPLPLVSPRWPCYPCRLPAAASTPDGETHPFRLSPTGETL